MPDAATRRKFEALVAAAFADGYLAEVEKNVLQEKAERMGISKRDYYEILGLGQQRKLTVAIPATEAERDALLEDLIEVAVADGRVEASEYSILARVAESLKIGLPDLRLRVNRRMQGRTDRPAGGQTRRENSPPPAARRPEPPPAPPAPAAAAFPPPGPAVPAPPPLPPNLEFPRQETVANLPPVTLQLLKQSILFDNEGDSVAAIGRTLAVPAEEAARIRRAILEAFPELKPASLVVRSGPRR
jgi:uncharacterized tellurite resistance protein B-like protein